MANKLTLRHQLAIQGGGITTVQQGEVPLLDTSMPSLTLHDSYNRTVLVQAVNFLRSGSPAVQLLLEREAEEPPLEEIYSQLREFLNAIKRPREALLVIENKNKLVVTIERHIH
jgi:hypothetical protein